MIASKRTTLRPLIESDNGIHLTVYLQNRIDLIYVKAQLREAIVQAQDCLTPVMSSEDRMRFLEPLESLLTDSRIFEQMRGNIGIFRNKDSFRMLNIPVEVEYLCQVATSFHVKPLLKWLQSDQDFLLLGIEDKAAHIYLGSQESFKHLDSLRFPEANKTIEAADLLAPWLKEWFSLVAKDIKPKLFFAGCKDTVRLVSETLKYKNSIYTPVLESFDNTQVGDACFAIRKILKMEAQKFIEKALLEFRFAEEDNRTRKNLFQIAKAVIQGRVRKLIVSDDLSIFGKIDKVSGGLSIHPCDLDHEDDDILDDLAQMVLNQGGEVVVAPKNEIPKGRPILAILDYEQISLEKSKDILQEQFG